MLIILNPAIQESLGAAIAMRPSSKHLDLTYRAYILRLWQERPASSDRPAVWRFSLEDTRARRRLGFGSLEELTAFLEEQVGARQQGS
jgi:hypothetical protein